MILLLMLAFAVTLALLVLPMMRSVLDLLLMLAIYQYYFPPLAAHAAPSQRRNRIALSQYPDDAVAFSRTR